MTDPDSIQGSAGQKENVEAAILQFTDKIKFKLDRRFDVPLAYNDNKIALLVRDPWTIFAFWEIRKDIEEKARESIREKGLTAAKSVLRVYDVTEGENELDKKIFLDFELKDRANTWYVHTGRPNRKWMADIGIFCTTGEFFCLARSNVVTTPNYGMSEIYDEEWMCPEEVYYKMFAATGGFDVGKSSLEMKEMITRYLREWISSGGVSSGMFSSGGFFTFGK